MSYRIINQDYILGGVIVAHASLGSIWAIWVASQSGYPIWFLLFNIALALVGVTAGIGWLRKASEAGALLVLFYMIQLVHVTTQNFKFSFTLGFDFILSMYVILDGSKVQLGFNVLAAAMILWAVLRPQFQEGINSESPSNIP